MEPKLGTPPGDPTDSIGTADRSRRRRAIRAARLQRRAPSTGSANVERRLLFAARRQTRSRPAMSATPTVYVVDNFPQSIPVSSRELDVVETYLDTVLDDAFGKRE
jgi:hypothetical protein